MILYLLSFILLLGNIQSEIAVEEPFLPELTDDIEPLPSARVLGGRDASEGQFPHQISLRIRGSHTCGGSIISVNYILTAAHCVFSGNSRLPATSLTIRAGSNSLTSGGVIAQVATVTPHASYRSNGFNNDIALLRLSTPLNLSGQIQKISLASTEVPSGAAVVISGWGRTANRGSLPNRLQFNTLNALDNTQCRRRIRNAPASILCLAHRNGNGACSGDSGGPAVYNGLLVGVTNFVIGGCGTTAPDGYAKVSAYINWIRQNSDV